MLRTSRRPPIVIRRPKPWAGEEGGARKTTARGSVRARKGDADAAGQTGGSCTQYGWTEFNSKGKMMHNLKTLGLTLAAVFLIGAVGVSAVSANQFHFGSTNTTVTRGTNATQFFEYEAGGQVVECSTVGGAADVTSQTTTEVTFTPTYSGCQLTFILFTQVTVNMNGCFYMFTITGSANSGTVHLKCPEGKSVALIVKSSGFDICTLHIGEQTPPGESDYSNSGSNKVKVTATQIEIKGTRQGSSQCGAASSSQGQYLGEVVVKCEETGTTTEKACQVG
jgi:hypothetical protein